MLMGLYNADLRKTCLIFMPKEIKHEREIKVVLDHQLINLWTCNMDPRAPAQGMSGLLSNAMQEVLKKLVPEVVFP